jgi:hypothetical protein
MRMKEQQILNRKEDNKTPCTHCLAWGKKLDGRRKWSERNRMMQHQQTKADLLNPDDLTNCTFLPASMHSSIKISVRG